MRILTSASRIVFLAIAFTACTAFFFGKLDPKDFMILAAGAFSFYFGKKD